MSLRERIATTDHAALADELVALLASLEAAHPHQRWSAASELLYQRGASFEAHCRTREECFPDLTTAPMWLPDPMSLTDSNIARHLTDSGLSTYDEFHAWSIAQRAAFWGLSIEKLGICFRTEPTATLEPDSGIETPEWLPGASFNIVDSCLQARGDSPAILFPGPGDRIHSITVDGLKADVLRVAGAIRHHGFEPGDRIAIVMPMIPESVSIYLGIIAAGCVAVSIADSFAAPEIATRLSISNARGIFCLARYDRAGRIIELFSRICEAEAPKAIVIGEADLRPDDMAFSEFVRVAEPLPETRAAGAGHHINVLFSSGTTGDPKAIPWPQTVAIKCATDGMWHQDIRSGDVVVWPTNIGWMMGPWLIFAALMNKATIGLAPLGDGFGRFVQDARVTMLGVVPTLVRTWRASKCMEAYDWSAIRCFSSTGEASSPEDMCYLSWLAGGRPVIEYCGGTEIGGGYACSTVVQPNVLGTFSTAALGCEILILDEDDSTADEGELFIVPPSIGLSTELLNRDHHATYYEGTPTGEHGQLLRRHGDHFERLANGYFRAGGRADDTMNLGGIKVSSAEIERVLNRVDGISESAAVALPAPGGGPSELIAFVVPEATCDRDTLQERMTAAIKSNLNPLFRLRAIRYADSLPRTASNKVMRRKLRAELLAERESGQD